MRPQGHATSSALDLASLFSMQHWHLDHFVDRLNMSEAMVFTQVLLDVQGVTFFTNVFFTRQVSSSSRHHNTREVSSSL
jgi:Uri superfamily endonuclease